jgi:phytoene synthase
MRQPVFQASIGRVVQRLLSEADRLYARADQGVALLPRDCQAAIRAAGMVYAEIGREVERHELNSVDRRAVVSSRRKLMLVGKSLARPTRPRRILDSDTDWDPALQATQFLVDAAVGSAATSPESESQDQMENGRVVWLIDLFERREAERRRRNNHAGLEPEALASTWVDRGLLRNAKVH